MIIRNAKPVDAEAAAVLILSAIKDIAEALTGETAELEILRVLRDYFKREKNRLSYRNSIILETKGEIAGIVIAYHGSEAEQLDAPIRSRLKQKMQNAVVDKEAEVTDYYLDTLCVAHQHRGKRMGTMLIAAAEEKGRRLGYATIALNVEKDNERARSLYSRLGYKFRKVILINHHNYDYMVKNL
ncbi:N-acetyltransferase [Bacillus sp. M6-12]|uniref:GNAT family N-acetyltransferase n=1 Tax=Bacillus sp. M6-12 TaxID=2054166 RepID=UPI000C758017|nr:GNAT family N-acetyltransferase [Bacillus sp. M6-12]PLS16999.1 N-acetyltransferase [Bacillus sp. M6-12]